MCCAVYPASSIADLSAVDAAVSAMELQVQSIKDRLREETETIPKTKALSLSLSLFLFFLILLHNASNLCFLLLTRNLIIYFKHFVSVYF